MKEYRLAPLFVFLSGCSSLTATVTWQPELAGATIVEQRTGKVLGSNVIALYYHPRAEHVSTPGCFDINGVTAKWPSGYESSTTGTVQLCRGYRDDYLVKIPYAANAEQRAVDVPYAVEYNRVLQSQIAAKAAENDRLVAAAILATSNAAAGIYQAQNSTTPYYQSNSTTRTQQTTSAGCRSDFECSSGKVCIKAPMSAEGVCLTPVNSFGTPQPRQLPSYDSVLPNYNLSGQCQFDIDCSVGFRCDTKLKVCVK